MHIFGLGQCPMVGTLTKSLLQAQRDDLIPPTREAALEYVYKVADSLGLKAVNPPFDIPDEPPAPAEEQ